MLSDDEKRKLIEQYSFGRDINAFTLVAEVERAVLSKASQQVAGFDECCATGQSCEYEICTLNGEQQCKYCGKEHPDMEPVQAMPAPKQEPYAFEFYAENDGGWTPQIAHANNFGLNKTVYDFDFKKIKPLYEHPAPPQAAAIPENARLVTVDQLKAIHRELDACQKVVWQIDGADPSYCRDAQAQLKVIDGLLSAAPKPEEK